MPKLYDDVWGVKKAKRLIIDEDIWFGVFDEFKDVVKTDRAEEIAKTIMKSGGYYTQRIPGTDLKLSSFDEEDSINLMIYNKNKFFYVGGIILSRGTVYATDTYVNKINAKTKAFMDELGGVVTFTYKGKKHTIIWK